MNFSVKIENDLLNMQKVFRIKFGDKVIGLGSVETLESFSNEDLGNFLTLVLDEALKILIRNIKSDELI